MTMALMGVPGQVMGPPPPEGYGCAVGNEKRLMDNPYGLIPFRHDKGNFQGILTAGTSLRFAGKQGFDLFVQGDGEQDTQAGWPTGFLKTQSEVTAYDKGALTERGTMMNRIGNFEFWGISLAVERPYYPLTVGDNTDPTKNLFFARDDNSLTDSEQSMREFFINNIGVSFFFGKTRCTWLMGTASMWPTNSGPTGAGEVVSNGANAAIGMYLGFTTSLYAGAADEPSKLKVHLEIGNLGLDEVDNEQIPFLDDVNVPAKVILWGRQTAGPQCIQVPAGVTPAEAEAGVLASVQNLSPQQRLDVLKRALDKA